MKYLTTTTRVRGEAYRGAIDVIAPSGSVRTKFAVNKM